MSIAAYDPAFYQLEKLFGRRLPNGLQPLKRLTPRHRAILALHLAGIPNREIAIRCRIKDATVSRIIHDPLGQAFLQAHIDAQDARFSSMYEKAIDVLDDGMHRSQRMQDRLKASDQYFRKRGDFERDTGAGRETAEDVIQQIYSRIEINQTNHYNGAQVPVQRTTIVQQEDEDD